MPEFNRQRALVAHLVEFCERRGIKLTAFSDDWIFCLQKDGHVAYIFGYDFGLNSAVAKMICKDKAATSDLLAFHGVPRVEHRIFHGPQLQGYVQPAGNWRTMLAFLEANPQGIVCKLNEGTGGNGVFLATTEAQLESAVHQIFAKTRSLCLSPFEELEHEYRVALLCGEIEFVYRKIRPRVCGDGKRTIRELLLDQWREAKDFLKSVAGAEGLTEMDIDFDRIPSPGEWLKLNWRHNLGQGSTPEMLESSDPARSGVVELARRAAEVLGIQVASVDIAATSQGMKVLEINSGIMMESLVLAHPDGKAIAGKFYDRILCKIMGMEADS